MAFWAADMTADHRAFKDALTLMRATITESRMRAAVAELPEGIRARLMAGPLSARYGCGVCEAFGRAWFTEAEPDLTDPRWIVWAYHEVPKSDMARRDQVHFGALANETYVRCLATYRAAGWEGDAPEPDA